VHVTEAVVMLGAIEEASQTLLSHVQLLKATGAFSRQSAEMQTVTGKIDAAAVVFLAMHAELHGGAGALHTWLRCQAVPGTCADADWPCCCAGYHRPPALCSGF
jgi:hypothetical protein